MNVEPFCFPLCCKHTCIDLFWLCADACHRQFVLVQQWLPGFCMISGHFFEPHGLSNCFSFSHFGVMRLGCVLVTSCQETVMLRRFFQGLHAFRWFKSLLEQWTTLQLPYLGDRSLTCLSNADRKIMTRTQKKRTEVLLNGGSTTLCDNAYVLHLFTRPS